MVKETVFERLLDRELGTRSRFSNVRGIYGDKKWVRDLDIVNELDAHRGCVNALRYVWNLQHGFISGNVGDADP